MYDVTIVMTTGKVFRFQTDEESKPKEYQFRHENNQLFWIPVGDDGIYLNPMHIVSAEFRVINKQNN